MEQNLIKAKRFPIPLKFHTLIKFEAIKSGKTMTKYMEDVANEAEERDLKLRDCMINGVKKNEKRNKFVPRF